MINKQVADVKAALKGVSKRHDPYAWWFWIVWYSRKRNF